MNNPKYKARQLVEKYSSVDLQPYSEFGDYMIYEAAKQCALIAVDELIDSHLVLTTTHDLKPSIRCKRFWQQVKQEIEKI